MNELMNVNKDEMILKLKDDFTLDHKCISAYGNEVSKQLTEFSTEILKEVKIKDTPEVEELLLSLVGELNAMDCTALAPKKKTFLSKFFGGNDIKTAISKYESVQEFIAGVSKKLSQAEYSLNKDIEICNNYIAQTKEYISTLDIYLEAGKQKLEEIKAEFEEQKKNADKDDMLVAQELSLKESDINMFERKLHNLSIQRVVAIQNIPQLMLIRDGDIVLVEKINASLDTSIPLWEKQMVIAIEAMRQANGAKLVKTITDTNNELLRRNSILLKNSTTAVAVELERDIVDLETLQDTNNNLIATIQEIRQIRDNGIKSREAVALELKNLQTKLIETTINN